MKKLQIVLFTMFFILSAGFSGLVSAADAGNMSDANVPITTEIPGVGADLTSELGGGSAGGAGGAGDKSGKGTECTEGTKGAKCAGKNPEETYYDKLLNYLGL